MEIYLIRHGKTLGNLHGRYIGSTDESLCEEGRKELLEFAGRGCYPAVDRVFASPMLRCLETSRILFPQISAEVVEDLRECDFGSFENKNYIELSANREYQRWIDSNGTLPFPAGESRKAFRARCCQAFAGILKKLFQSGEKAAAMVVHGGTIMSILEKYAWPEKDFYGWHVKNGGGYRIEVPEKFDGNSRCVQTVENMIK